MREAVDPHGKLTHTKCLYSGGRPQPAPAGISLLYTCLRTSRLLPCMRPPHGRRRQCVGGSSLRLLLLFLLPFRCPPLLWHSSARLPTVCGWAEQESGVVVVVQAVSRGGRVTERGGRVR